MKKILIILCSVILLFSSACSKDNTATNNEEEAKTEDIKEVKLILMKKLWIKLLHTF